MAVPDTERRAERASPKTTSPESASRRSVVAPRPARRWRGRLLDALPDRIDIRDWFYQPSLRPLPPRLDRSPWTQALDQKGAGACTGFALAAVINFLFRVRMDQALCGLELGDAPRAIGGERSPSVSPRMLYEMARRYDEWPGEAYEGSSARGAMKGWMRHGVCLRAEWPDECHGVHYFTPDLVQQARAAPGGAFFRVMHREVRDMHAALGDVGALYCTLMIHEGWAALDDLGRRRDADLPLIRRTGGSVSGHAVAIVGYTDEGFIVLNSWGEQWGRKGCALLPYEDYMLHATDVWVAQLGVPVNADIWSGDPGARDYGAKDYSAGLYRATPVIPLADIRPYVIDVGNDGRLSDTGDYWTTRKDVERLCSVIIPEKTARWPKRRVMLYLHGGLNDESAVARRIVAFKDVLIANEIYPVHIMWETGLLDTIRHMIADLFGETARGSVADWLEKTRNHLIEAKDWTFELTASRPGSALWAEMTENAARSSSRPDGAGTILAQILNEATGDLASTQVDGWELHIVAHSAGAIYCAHALDRLIRSRLPLASVQFLAPALTIKSFRQKMLPHIRSGDCPPPELYVLSDAGERDDDVGPYGKSLLYLVSNAFEGTRGEPLLGMQRFLQPVPDDDPPRLDPEIETLFRGRLIVAGARPVGGLLSRSETHGGFDNDVSTMNSVMRRILGSRPRRPFKLADLQF